MLELKTAHLKAALTHAAKSDIRHYLNGVCLTVGENGMTYLLATDGARAFIGSFLPNWTDGEQKGTFQIIIPRDTVTAAIKLADNYTVTDLPLESITVDAPALTLEPMETENERHARLIATANTREVTDKPLAQQGLRSYRYKGRYSWIMIGARDTDDALKEAQRSADDKVTVDKLEVFIRGLYIPAKY